MRIGLNGLVLATALLRPGFYIPCAVIWVGCRLGAFPSGADRNSGGECDSAEAGRPVWGVDRNRFSHQSRTSAKLVRGPSLQSHHGDLQADMSVKDPAEQVRLTSSNESSGPGLHQKGVGPACRPTAETQGDT